MPEPSGALAAANFDRTRFGPDLCHVGTQVPNGMTDAAGEDRLAVISLDERIEAPMAGALSSAGGGWPSFVVASGASGYRQ